MMVAVIIQTCHMRFRLAGTVDGIGVAFDSSGIKNLQCI